MDTSSDFVFSVSNSSKTLAAVFSVSESCASFDSWGSSLSFGGSGFVSTAGTLVSLSVLAGVVSSTGAAGAGAGALPKSGLVGNPDAVVVVVDDLEGLPNILKGLLPDPKADLSALVEPKPPLLEPKPPLLVLVLEPKPPVVEFEDSAANPPPDGVVVDPKVVDPKEEDPNPVEGFAAGLDGVVVALPNAGVAVPLPKVEVVPKPEDPPSDEVAPKIDEDVPFLLKAANGDSPDDDGLPNVSPLEVPDPKVDEPNGEEDDSLAPEPNVDDPDTPNENGVLAVVGAAVSAFVSGALSLSATVGFDSSESAALVSSTTTHEALSGVDEASLGSAAAAMASGSFGRSSTDPSVGVAKNASSFMC